MIIMKSSFSSSSLSVCSERRHILARATKYAATQPVFSTPLLPHCCLTAITMGKQTPPASYHTRCHSRRHWPCAHTRNRLLPSGCFTGGHSRFYTGTLVGGRRARNDQYTVHDVKGLWQTLRQAVRQHVLCYQHPPPPPPVVL